MSQVFYPRCRAVLQVIFEGFGPTALDSEVTVIPVVPKSCTIHRNSYRQADSWELSLDAGDLPFDPDMIRAGAVEIYLYNAPGNDDLSVLGRQDPLAVGQSTATRSSLDAAALEAGAPLSKERFTAESKPLIAGLFDRDSLELSESGGWVSLGGQDYTAHLAAMQWPPEANGRARRIPVGKRIDLLLEDILAEADPQRRLALDVRGIERTSLPVVGSAEVRGNKRGIPVEQNTSYWDVMYKLATRYGLILFVDGLDVVLTRPKNLDDLNRSSVKRLAWGRNLQRLELSRDLGKEQSPNIVVRGYDETTKKTVTVEYPSGPTDTKTSVRTSKKGKQTTTVRQRDEYQIVTAYGITDPAILRKMAENLYHTLGRAERRVVASTRDLVDLDGRDLLRLGAGDAVQIEWADYNRALLQNPEVPTETKVDHLMRRGYNRQVAALLATKHTQLEGLRRPLRVREASYDWDTDNGLSIELELVDFIVVEGRRDGSQPSRNSTRPERVVQRDGSPLGWTPEEQARRAR